MLYFAYGLNTDRSGMSVRCPDAQLYGAAQLLNHRFCFRFHADVDYQFDSRVDGLLWDISDRDLDSLDILEGYPEYYERHQLSVVHNNTQLTAWTYSMVDKSTLSLPDQWYLEKCTQSYLDNQLSLKQIVTALEEINGKQYKIRTHQS